MVMVGRIHSRRHHHFAAVAAAFVLLAAVVPSAALGATKCSTGTHHGDATITIGK
jgi:hypothetical protein